MLLLPRRFGLICLAYGQRQSLTRGAECLLHHICPWAKCLVAYNTERILDSQCSLFKDYSMIWAMIRKELVNR